MFKRLTISPSDWIGGTTTFFTVVYIVVVNPAILSTPGTGLSFPAVMTATVLLCFLMTLLMGAYAKLPFAVAPGMGVNAFFTYGLILGQGIPALTALGMVFWAGVLFLVISLTPLRVRIAESIPDSLRHGLSAGIGLFLTFIGLQNGGWVVANEATLVHVGKWGWEPALVLFGVMAILILMRRRHPLSFLLVIAGITTVQWWRGQVTFPTEYFTAPDFSLFGAMDWRGALQFSLLPAMLSILFTDLFDSIATFVGVASATGLTDSKGRPLRLKEGLLVDSFATLGAGLFGTSSGTAFIESAAGIEAGGRTGRSAWVTALWFLPCFFIGPWAAAVPKVATAPVLIVVGLLMFRGFPGVSGKPWEEALPAFLTLVLVPLTFSITQGILWGVVAHFVMFVLAGRWRELRPTLWIIAALCLVLLGIENR